MKAKELIQSIKLKEPFPMENIEWRVQQSGNKNGKCWAIVLPYLQARAIMDRLDDVFGMAGWNTSLKWILSPKGIEGVSCTIEAFPSKHGIKHSDVSETTQVEALKGAVSGAIKRAAVHFGVGRYLYDIDGVLFADVCDNGKYSSKTKDNTYFKWDAPNLPAFCHPRENIDIALDIATCGLMNSEKREMYEYLLEFYKFDIPQDKKLLTTENVSKKLKKQLTEEEKSDIIILCERLRILGE